MKLRFLLIPLFALALSACNLTLAEDVTPPPNYVAPTPMPTLVLVPPQTPNVANGAAIYTEKCLPCHGETGLGDGPQGLQLGVTVKAFGLPEIARPASPEQYYTVVTRGNIERLMPPFNSLNDQERWDVIAYALTLHTTPEQVARGKQLFEENCANCATTYFRDPANMSHMSEVELARLAREGNDSVPAFGANMSDEDLWAVAAYLRSLSFDNALLAQPVTASASETPIAAEAGTPSAGETPVGTAQAAAGTVRGKVEPVSGGSLPADITVTLHGFEHNMGQNPGAQEALTLEGTVNADGTYAFENVDMPEGRIFVAEATYSGVTLQSDTSVVQAGQTQLDMAPITLYAITTESTALVIDDVSLFFHSSKETAYDVLSLYTFRNTGSEVVAVKMAEQQEIPFIKFPKGGEALGYEATQDSAPFISMSDGFAMRPTEQAYGIVAFSSIPKQDKTNFSQEFSLPVTSIRIFVPDGMEVQGTGVTIDTPQDIQGTTYQTYLAGNLKAGQTLTFELTGQPSGAGSSTSTAAASTTNWLLYGAVGLGLALILGGAWLYWRDRTATQTADEETEEQEEESEFASSEEVLDAIVALDDLHRDKKISEEAYQKRRAELKNVLKGLM